MSPTVQHTFKPYDKVEVSLLDYNDRSKRVTYVATFIRYVKEDKVEIQVNSVTLILPINRVVVYNGNS